MDKEYILERLDILEQNLSEFKDAVKRAQENALRAYLDRVKYMVNGLSIVVTDIGHKFIGMNEGRTINGVILEKPMNVRDIFVKLGEVNIIPGKAVPQLKKLIHVANVNTVDIKDISETVPAVEVFIFYIRTFLRGVELTDEVVEEMELIQKKEIERQKPPAYNPQKPPE
jgi:uncharacterized protein YutE (UPF0331/DUF86 family)